MKNLNYKIETTGKSTILNEVVGKIKSTLDNVSEKAFLENKHHENESVEDFVWVSLSWSLSDIEYSVACDMVCIQFLGWA